MAQRRMFSLEIVDTDAFLEMPLSSQALYFHLGMRADDDGFIANPKKISRTLGASDDDMRLLIAKRFVMNFESGVLVIKHWKINNFIRSDRYHETTYLEEKSALAIKENGSYTEKDRLGIPTVYQRYTEDSIGKDSIGKNRLEKETDKQFSSISYLQSISTDEMGVLQESTSATVRQIQDKGLSLYDYCLSKGKRYKDYRAFLRNALRRDFPPVKKVELLSDLIK